jgi:hypothetical protein
MLKKEARYNMIYMPLFYFYKNKSRQAFSAVENRDNGYIGGDGRVRKGARERLLGC